MTRKDPLETAKAILEGKSSMMKRSTPMKVCTIKSKQRWLP